MNRKRAEDFGRFEKVSLLSWELDSDRERSIFGARKGQTNLRATGAARDRVGRWKSQNWKNVYIFPCVEEPLNSKVIKSFVPELRSRKCFSCFGIPTFYVYMLWTFYVCFTYPYHGYGTLIYLVPELRHVVHGMVTNWVPRVWKRWSEKQLRS